MRSLIIGLIAVGSLATVSTAVLADCLDSGKSLGVARTIKIDSTGGPKFGTIQYPSTIKLKEREVILTFDDGPHPQYTPKILKALAAHCTRATFFPVGRMARAYPKTLQAVVKAGHTIGGHTYRHPNLARLSKRAAIRDIEKGFQAIRKYAGAEVAPFFRFPFLSDTKRLRQYAAERDLAIFSVDIVSNDSYTPNANRLVRRTIAQLKRKGGGIVLFHDIKRSTARGMMNFLNQLKANNFKIVHVVAKTKFSDPAPMYLTGSAADTGTSAKSSTKRKPKPKKAPAKSFGPRDVFDFPT